MAKFSEEFKSSMIKKVLTSPDRSLSSIASEANLNGPTLHRWLNTHKNDIMVSNNSKPKRPNDWPREQKFEVLLASSNLSDEELGAFCRKKGIYIHQLTSWKAEFMANTASKLTEKQKCELKTLRLQNKALKSDLNRKNQALAETTALLVLKKKADLIWGESEAD